MKQLGFVERLQTIVATATVTSAIWIVIGAVYFSRDDTRALPAPAAPARVVAAGAPPSPPAPATPGELLVIPVRGVDSEDLTDTYSESRGGRRHEAIDIMAPAGTPVVAAAAGTVEKLFRSVAGGNTVYIRSADRRTIYYYAHLQDYAPALAEGAAVRPGEALGTVGFTGNADPAAPHLHFAVLRIAPEARWYESAAAINPYPLLRPR